MDKNGQGVVDFARVAEEQTRKQQQLAQDLKDAMERPLTVEKVTVVAFAARVEGKDEILSVASPDGKRRDFPINAVVKQSLRLALFPPEAEAAA